MVWGSVICFMLKPRRRYAGTPLNPKYIILYIYMCPSGSVKVYLDPNMCRILVFVTLFP